MGGASGLRCVWTVWDDGSWNDKWSLLYRMVCFTLEDQKNNQKDTFYMSDWKSLNTFEQVKVPLFVSVFLFWPVNCTPGRPSLLRNVHSEGWNLVSKDFTIRAASPGASNERHKNGPTLTICSKSTVQPTHRNLSPLLSKSPWKHIQFNKGGSDGIGNLSWGLKRNWKKANNGFGKRVIWVHLLPWRTQGFLICSQSGCSWAPEKDIWISWAHKYSTLSFINIFPHLCS